MELGCKHYSVVHVTYCMLLSCDCITVCLQYLSCLSTSSSNDKLAFDVGLQETAEGNHVQFLFLPPPTLPLSLAYQPPSFIRDILYQHLPFLCFSCNTRNTCLCVCEGHLLFKIYTGNYCESSQMENQPGSIYMMSK